MQRKPKGIKWALDLLGAWETRANQDEGNGGLDWTGLDWGRTIGDRQPSVLLLDIELIREAAAVWVLRIVHLCFVVG